MPKNSDIVRLTPGIGFHLQPDGTWAPEKIPDEVIDHAEFSGYLTINGYRSTVFDTEDGSWAQKSVSVKPKTTDEIVASVAKQLSFSWAKNAKSDLVSQVSDLMDDDRSDSKYNEAIVDYCDDAIAVVEKMQLECRELTEEFISSAHELSESKNKKIKNMLADQTREALVKAALEIRTVSSKTLGKILNNLASQKKEASK